jgi:trk system potassium uptake protein TrkH
MVVVTFAIEAVGMLALVRPFAEVAPERDAWALAAFHSVSAFCNAGFSTLDGNLVRATAAVRVNAVIMTLIALGGLGFSTLVLTSTWLVQRARRHRIQLRMSVRLVWITSAWLWVGGTVALVVLEWGGALSGLSPAHRFLVAAFHSVTARTAGFNTIDISAFSGASLLVLMLLMYVGGAPGSTAGGIKVTTVAVMLGVVRSTLRGDGRVVVGGREIHEASLREAIAVVFVGGLVVVVALGILLCVEPLPFLPLAFESVSALGTVGLSLGITPQLSGVGKVVLMLLMLVGRVGPLTLVLAVGRAVAARERYPTERVPVG